MSMTAISEEATIRPPVARPVAELPSLLGFLLLAIWVACARWASFDTDLTQIDEGFYRLQGDAWLHGIPPYTAIWDVKPPGLIAFFAIFRLFGAADVLASRIA